mgnify:CR=1 FL=1
MISLDWVADYIDISDQDLKELAVKITKAGINIEKVITNHIDNLKIGKVIECLPHPDSDHLHVCKVDIGSEILQIVCGASNIKEDINVIVALPGAILPGNFEIKKSKIRGVESSGMICALFELGLEEKTEENYNKGIEIIDNKAKVGEDPIKYLKLDDTIYELDIHKHRNNDCYYHIGFAYEIGAILNRKVTLPEDNYNEIEDNINNHFTLKVETDKCPYYLAKMVSNVEIKESPDFIKKRLNAAGMRSINNVVDISNYVMLEYGQPMHFFDKDKLGDTILVRDAKEKEEITTLDGKRRILKSSDIVITDGKDAVCIAGIMGGESTEVDNNTKNILIESAIFDPVSIRYTASNLNLKSEASIRYGKGLNFEYTNLAINRACYLLEKYANAKVLSGIAIHDKIKKEDKIVKFKPDEINKMLGITISTDDMKIELERLGFDYELKEDTFIVTIPKRRLDIDPNINDIAEEIGRLYGYHNLVSTMPLTNIKKGQYKGKVKYRKILSKRLRSLGLNEVKTYTLVSPDMSLMFNYENKNKIVLPNPLSQDKSIIRTTILPSLYNVYKYNKDHKINDILIYEIANTYNKVNLEYVEDTKISALLSGNYLDNGWGNKMKVDFYLVKGIVENILDFLGFKNRYTFVQDSNINNLHPGISAKIMLDKKPIGIIGKIHPNLEKDDVYVFEIDMNSLIQKTKPLKFKEANIYPSIVKDMAFIVDKNITADELINTIKKSGGKLLSDIKIFDVYEGKNISDNKISIAFSLKFEDYTKTLTDEEVNIVFNKIIGEVKNKHNAILRDN